MKKELVAKNPKYIVFDPDTSYTPLIWDDEGAAIGDINSFFIGEKRAQGEMSVDSPHAA